MGKPSEKPSGPGKGTKNGEKIPQKSRSTGKTTTQLMKKHISDKNDVISEEDFKNLNIDLDISEQPVPLPGGAKRPKDEDKDPENITPWDVISE